MAVIGMVEGADEVVDLAQRPQLLDFGRSDDLKGHPYGVGRAAVFAVFVHAVAPGRKPQVAGHVEADILAGLLFKCLVQIDGVLVDLSDRIAQVKERQQTGGMPS